MRMSLNRTLYRIISMDHHSLWDIPEGRYCLGLLFMQISLMRDVVFSTTTIVVIAVRGYNLGGRGEECLEGSVVHRRMEGSAFTNTSEVATVASDNIQAIYLDNMVLHQLEDIDHKDIHHVLAVHLQTVI